MTCLVNRVKSNSLNESRVQAIVNRAIDNRILPLSSIYLVLGSPDVQEYTPSMKANCGWHNYFIRTGYSVLYSWVGNAVTRNNCGAENRPSVNNDPGGDAMVNVIFHEISEAVTDPYLNAWYSDDTKEENADKCVWNFMTAYTTSNGARANVSFAGRNWLIQANWVNSGGGYCSL